jgi:poly(hydroxyalkanoate) depolymerase family esterase
MDTNNRFMQSMRDAMERLRTHGPSEAMGVIQRALNITAHESTEAGRDDRMNTMHREVHGGADPVARPPHDPSGVRPQGTEPSRFRGDLEPAGFSLRTFRAAAGQRDYKLYVPPTSGTQPRALIVMLHGCTQDADDFAAGTRMNEIAQREGILLVYPIQPRSANPSKCWNWFKTGDQHRGRGEPSLIEGMTREVMDQYGVDPARVYVAGLSAGGAMADIMIHTYPELYAAAGVHSGLPCGSARDLPSALAAMKGGGRSTQDHGATPLDSTPVRPLIVFHGDRDTTVHPSNATALLSTFASVDSPVIESVAGSNAQHASTVNYLRAANGVQAEQWIVHGAGHAWAGGSAKGSYTDPRGPDASAEMVRFFLAHPLQAVEPR